MAYRKQKAIYDFILLPWWLNLIIAAVIFVALRYALPAISTDNPYLQSLLNALPALALPLTFVFLLAAVLSALNRWRKRRLLDAQTGLESIQNESWQRFEALLGEAYRRQGYQVQETGGGGADGGIDLILSKPGEKVLVQCKRRRNSTVGVRDVRELYGVMISENADKAVLATAGRFSQDAEHFAEGKALTLLPGPEVAALIKSVQSSPAVPSAGESGGEDSKPVPAENSACPNCGSDMVLRTARRGHQAGQQFWGCSRFPNCQGTRPYSLAS